MDPARDILNKENKTQMQSDQSSCFTIWDRYNTCGPRKQGRWHGGCRFDPKLGGDEVSKSGSGIVFPPPCPCLAFTVEHSRNITHTLSADPHIAHSCFNKREVEMEKWTLRQAERRILGMFDETASEIKLATHQIIENCLKPDKHSVHL